MIAFDAATGTQVTRVRIGPLAAAMAEVRAIHPAPLVISEPRVWALHGAALGDGVDPLLVPAGEAAKTAEVLLDLIARMAARGLARDGLVLAFGGGAVGDLAGLAASLFMRGVAIVQVPTTLLAQADSALGGKTAIDVGSVKNLVGSFHPPAMLLADPALLATLDPAERASGLAEVVKYGFLGDSALVDWCEAHAADLAAGATAVTAEAIEAALRAKARIVAADPYERTGLRARLNLGHSFGHGLETVAGLGAVRHGEAVAVGIVLAFGLAAELGLCSAADGTRAAAILAALGLPTRPADLGLAGRAEAVLAAMAHDKKNVGTQHRLVLPHGIGEARLVPVDAALLAAYLARQI